MKALNIVESAYRATIEEQDDTIVWLTHAMKAAGADLGVLLRGNAVNYAVRGQNAAGLAFGSWRQTQPPRIADDVLAEDLTERGLEAGDLVPGLERITRDGLPALFAGHDQIWHW